MRTSRRGSTALQAAINVTPLVDVVLVLLIIFMVIVPLTLRGYDVDIPGEALTTTAERQPAQILLAIEPEACPLVGPPHADGLPGTCRVRINDEELPVADLEHRIAQIFEPRGSSERVLFLEAHDELNYEGVMRIVDLARSGAEGLRIGIVTEKRVSS